MSSKRKDQREDVQLSNVQLTDVLVISSLLEGNVWGGMQMLCKNLVHRLFGWRTNSYHSGQLNRGLDSYSQNNRSKPKSVKLVHIWPILWGEPHSHSARWFEPPMKVSMLTEKSGDPQWVWKNIWPPSAAVYLGTIVTLTTVWQ